MTPITVPQMGVVEEIIVIEWLFAEGDQVAEGDDVVIIETDKAETTLPAPASGRLAIAVAASDQEVPVGTVLGSIES